MARLNESDDSEREGSTKVKIPSEFEREASMKSEDSEEEASTKVKILRKRSQQK